MMNSSLVGYCGFPALASAGCGLENLHNVYRRGCQELEGFFKIFCHQSATPAECCPGIHNVSAQPLEALTGLGILLTSAHKEGRAQGAPGVVALSIERLWLLQQLENGGWQLIGL
jgi:hypothetical protein